MIINSIEQRLCMYSYLKLAGKCKLTSLRSDPNHDKLTCFKLAVLTDGIVQSIKMLRSPDLLLPFSVSLAEGDCGVIVSPVTPVVSTIQKSIVESYAQASRSQISYILRCC